MRTVGLLARVIALVVLGAIACGLIVLAFGSIRIEPQREFTAAFADVSGLTDGTEVRAAGVSIGRVESIEIQPDNLVDVAFTVSREVPLTTGTRATVRFKNIIGDRYLELSRGPGPALEDGGTLPPSQTAPALDLDELYNGFTPLFEGLDPVQINQLSSSLIQVFQGQSGAVEGLVADVGSLTNTLADRDRLIGSLITNLNTVLDTANDRAPQLADLIGQLQNLVTRYAAQRGELGEGIERVNALAATTASFVPRIRDDVTGTLRQIDRLSTNVNADTANLNEDLRRVPAYYNTLARIGSNQSAFSFFLCGAGLNLPGIGRTPIYPDEITGNGTDRCRK